MMISQILSWKSLNKFFYSTTNAYENKQRIPSNTFQ